MRSIPSLDNGRPSDMQVTDAEVVPDAGLEMVPDVGLDVGPEVGLEAALDVGPDVGLVKAEMAAAAVNTRGTDSNTGIDIQMDNFDR